ncbi:general L-amino acid transport system permease protein [Mesorhizobium shonense]|uniref:General L-amino acid transport system permease protein n=1 Tax=Mesorhizobium shonense TaxID=1209948 RepID=A0ABV2HXD1_9HYPH
MSATFVADPSVVPAQKRRPPEAPSALSVIGRELFGTLPRAIGTAIFAVPIAYLAWRVLDWAVLGTVWRADGVEQCKIAAGACWSVIAARFRIILFGLYPYEDQWRSVLASLVIVVVAFLSCLPAFWTARRIIVCWAVGFAAYLVLMYGGILGLDKVTTDRWGGLSLTLFVFAAQTVIGMPLAILLMIARRSQIFVIAKLSAGLIDLLRAIPLLAILFTAAVVAPLALPEMLQGDKLTRVVIGYALFFAAYQAEIIRGGMQGVSEGQAEAARVLGLGKWQTLFYISLPQAFHKALPATVSQFAIAFKETSIITIVGFFDILASGHAAYGADEWYPYFREVYIFIGMIYFVTVFSLSRYGAFLERRTKNARA